MNIDQIFANNERERESESEVYILGSENDRLSVRPVVLCQRCLYLKQHGGDCSKNDEWTNPD